MAPVRVRGCARPAALSPGRLTWLADASRRQSGPRKATCRRPITVRLRSKSCPAGGSDIPRVGRRAVVAQAAANLSAGGCGVEDQVGRAGAAHDPDKKGVPAWTSSSRPGTPTCWSGSGSMRQASWRRSRSWTARPSGSTSRYQKSTIPGRAEQGAGRADGYLPAAQPFAPRRQRRTGSRRLTWRSGSWSRGCGALAIGERTATGRTQPSGCLTCPRLTWHRTLSSPRSGWERAGAC